MVTKKELLKNVQSYSPKEIADAIRAGIVTLYELGHDTEGQFTPLLKKQVKDILAHPATPRVESVATSQNSVEEKVNEQPVMDIVDEAPFEENTLVDAPFIMPSQENESGHEDKEVKANPAGNKSKPGMFRNPFSFKGRIRRLEYGLSYLFYIGASIILQGMLSVAVNSKELGGLIIALRFPLYVILFFVLIRLSFYL